MADKQDANQGEGKGAIGGGLSLIEKSWEWNWVLRVTTVVLFLDIALIVKSGHGLLAWDKASELLVRNLGFLAATGVAFGMLVALVLPLSSMVLREFLGLGIWKVLWWFRRRDDRYRSPRGCVLSGALREKALREHSDFLLRLYERHRSDEQMYEQARQTQADLLFGFLCLVSFDTWLALSGRASTSLAFSMVEACGENGAGLAILLGAAIVCILIQLWFPERDLGWIYYPPLADEIEAERRRS
jgi:hypothetical protein